MTLISVQEFANKYDGKSVDFDKWYGAQCVDLFDFYNLEVVGAPVIGTPVTGWARDLYEVGSAARDDNYLVLGPDSPIMIGDVLVYGPPHGRYIDGGQLHFGGHVTICVAEGRIIQQNGKISQKTTIDPLFYTGLIGILRPKRFEHQTSPQDAPQPSHNQNKHIIKKGDTFWGLEETKGWTHGTLQQLNPGLDPRSLSIGSEIIVPGEPTPVASPSETYYTIRPGDTFWGLEDAWGITHGTLQQLNPTLNPRALQIGERIRRS